MEKTNNDYIKELEAYFPEPEDKKLLSDLIEHASYLYKSLYRYSGEPYLTRALRLTCDKILKLKPDKVTIISSVLISAFYSPRCDLDKIETLFGEEVRDLVESLGKINAIKSRYSSSDSAIIRDMFLTLAEDIRVVLIRLADRIENMETLEYKSPEKQKANAKEILDVYVPIASRLGLYEYKLVLEDLAFRYVFPDEYATLKKDLDEYLGETKKSIDDAKHELENLMFRNGFNVHISGRVKNLFSIYKKLKKKTRTLHQIHDIYALRIILESDNDERKDTNEDMEQLYKILSVLHSRYQFLPERFKDYVSNPKPNGYQSIHTAIIGLNSNDLSKPTELQIRTRAMHSFSEHGYAAHWMYKEGRGSGEDGEMARALQDLKKNLNTIDLSTAELKMNLNPDKVFVLTPENLVRELPKGATPIDFAFSIHSDIGLHYKLAKVNGNVVSLDYELKNGDTVEVVTNKNVNTKLGWLEFAKTRLARNRIKSYFRSLDRENLAIQGKLEVNKLLARVGLPYMDDNYSFLKSYRGKRLSFKEREEILEEIGSGAITANTVFRGVMGKTVSKYKEIGNQGSAGKLKMLPKTTTKPVTGLLRLLIGGERNVPYRMSSCCKPKLRDRVVAYITKNKGVSIHKVDCSFVARAPSERLLDARLDDNKKNENRFKYQVSLLLEMSDGKGHLKEMIEFLNNQSVTVLSYEFLKIDTGKMARRVIIDIQDEEQLEKLITNLNLMEGVLNVTRM